MSDSDTNACGHPVLRRITATYEHALGLEDFPEYCERAFLEGAAPVHALLVRGRAVGPATVTGLNGDSYDIALAVRVIAGRGPSGQGDWRQDPRSGARTRNSWQLLAPGPALGAQHSGQHDQAKPEDEAARAHTRL